MCLCAKLNVIFTQLLRMPSTLSIRHRWLYALALATAHTQRANLRISSSTHTTHIDLTVGRRMSASKTKAKLRDKRNYVSNLLNSNPCSMTDGNSRINYTREQAINVVRISKSFCWCRMYAVRFTRARVRAFRM